jgi:hypothetical protein
MEQYFMHATKRLQDFLPPAENMRNGLAQAVKPYLLEIRLFPALAVPPLCVKDFSTLRREGTSKGNELLAGAWEFLSLTRKDR